MDVVAMVGGKATQLNAAQLAQHICGKSNRIISIQNANACATEILNHPGGNAAGGALGGIQYKGAAVYHKSRNLGGANGWCGVFFADSGNGAAKILLVGAHVGGTNANPVYDVDWIAPGWGASAHWQVGTRIHL